LSWICQGVQNSIEGHKFYSSVSNEVVETMAPPGAASNINEIINGHFMKVSRSSDKLQTQTFLRLDKDKNIQIPEEVDQICLRSWFKNRNKILVMCLENSKAKWSVKAVMRQIRLLLINETLRQMHVFSQRQRTETQHTLV